jgi:hypothetical protein
VTPGLRANRHARGALEGAVGGSTRREEGGRRRRIIYSAILEDDILEEKEGACLVERGEGTVEL